MVKVVRQCLRSQVEKYSYFFGYECTLQGDVYILSRQMAAPNVHITDYLKYLVADWLVIELFMLNWSV